MMESVARPVMGRLQLDEFASRQLDRVSPLLLTSTNLLLFGHAAAPKRPISFSWGLGIVLVIVARVRDNEAGR